MDGSRMVVPVHDLTNKGLRSVNLARASQFPRHTQMEGMYLRDGVPGTEPCSATPRMNPQALVYSRDVNLGAALSDAISRLKLGPVCTSRVGAALNLLRGHKFPAVIVDCVDRAAAADLFELCRRAGSNKSSVLFALTDENDTARSWGVTFALRRPVESDLRAFTTVLRAAHGMILQDFRRYRRVPIGASAELDNDEHSLQLPTVNVSEGGMCVRGEIPGFKKEHTVQLTHPEMNLRFRANSYVVWSRNGHSGVQFRVMSPACRLALANWLEAH